MYHPPLASFLGIFVSCRYEKDCCCPFSFLKIPLGVLAAVLTPTVQKQEGDVNRKAREVCREGVRAGPEGPAGGHRAPLIWWMPRGSDTALPPRGRHRAGEAQSQLREQCLVSFGQGQAGEHVGQVCI